MRRATRSAPLDPIERQIRRVRRRWNVRELERALFLTGGLASLGLSALLLLALRAGPRLFAAGTATVGATVAFGIAVVLAVGKRRWLPARRAPAWIDRRSRLRGGLATLVELGGRPAAFAPLLLEHNARRLPTWRPRAIVPRVTPLAALAALAAGIAALSAVVALAPRLRPPAPELIYAEGAGTDWPRGMDGLGQTSERLVVAPAPGSETTEGEGQRARGGIPTDDSSLARLTSSLQERLRDRLLGDDTERTSAAGEEGKEGTEGRRPTPRAGRGGPGPGTAGKARASADERSEMARTQGGEPDADERAGSGNGAGGAGSHTDPALYGITTPLAHTSDAAFQLAIAARVRAEHTGPRPPEGEAPPPPTDARPALGDRQRSEAGVHRMPLPAAYALVVRELFSHADR